MESECNGMAIHHIDGSGNMECSGYGREFVIELEGTTWDGRLQPQYPNVSVEEYLDHHGSQGAFADLASNYYK